MPLGPTGFGDSPYQCFSAFAGNPYLIDLRKLIEDGLLDETDLADAPDFPDNSVEYGDVILYKTSVLDKAYKHFKAGATSEQRRSLETFTSEQGYWLDDYALFMALKEANGGQAWNTWDEPLRSRDKDALETAKNDLSDDIDKQKVWQWLFYEQWLAVKAYANERDIQVIGDIPIFIAYDSADAWANPELFYFDDAGNPTVIAGVPPDYFSETGQRWGNPLYRWDKMKERGFEWWITRIRSTLEFFDVVRVDHFRGLEAYWEIRRTKRPP